MIYIRTFIKEVKKWYRACLLTAALALMINCFTAAARRSLLQQGIAEETIRFRVLANDDSEKSQGVKLQVRDAVLGWLEEQQEKEEQVQEKQMQKNQMQKNQMQKNQMQKNQMQKNQVQKKQMQKKQMQKKQMQEEQMQEIRMQETGKDRSSILEFYRVHLSEIEEIANQVLKENKVSYQAAASVEEVYFPELTYGECTFPAGWYQTLRIGLGKASGHNWWCMLYPRLCFSDCLHLAAEGAPQKEAQKEQQEQLQSVLTVEEYESLLRSPGEWKISFRWLKKLW